VVASEQGGMWQEVRSLGVFGRAWVVGILLFSVARALIAWPTLGRYGVNPWTFLLLDIVTALPYGVGQAVTVKILRSPDRSARAAAGWALVVTASFLAPYVYIFLASGSMPGLAYAGVLAWMVLFGVLAVVRMRRQVRNPLGEPSSDVVPTDLQAQLGSGASTAESPESHSTS
jgi:hypothetical protein